MLSAESGAMPFGWHVVAGRPAGLSVRDVAGVRITDLYLGIRGCLLIVRRSSEACRRPSILRMAPVGQFQPFIRPATRSPE
jgi:hypothetical protein